MHKLEIQNSLRSKHKEFADLIVSLNDEDFTYRPAGKWSAGQQLDHIYRSVSALALGLSLPKFVIRLYAGKANRPSRDFEALVAKYKLKLEAGGKAAGRYIPKEIDTSQKNNLEKKLLHSVDGLCKKLDRYNESQLDFYILPHPLLGKLTIREMLYFTIYHVKHHQDLTLKNLAVSLA
jgi:hypothetical protein